MNTGSISTGCLLLFAVLLPVVVFFVVFLLGRSMLWTRKNNTNRIRGIWFLSISYFVMGLVQGTTDGLIVNMVLWIALGIGLAVYAIDLSRRSK